MKVFATIIVAALALAAIASAQPTDSRVIKGEDAVPHSAPYIVSLSSRAGGSHICGGTIIATQWIVTAGHCVAKAEGMGVVAGLHERSILDEATQTRVVDFGRVHELFDGGVGPYDIALLHVSKPFEFNVNVQPASLPTNSEIPHGTAVLYGWGQLKAWQFGVAASTLQTVQLPVLEYEDCAAVQGSDSKLDPTNVCTDSTTAGLSACNGDSGGPLVTEIPGAPSMLVGIVSWGSIPCGTFKNPSVYTRMSAYIDWVAKIQNAYYTLF